MTPTGFVPADAAWWPAIRANIAKPWPKEAAMMDLRWHADRERMQDRANAMPGRPALIDRWGWTDWGVKQLLKGEEWVDRWTTEDAARTPPAHRQRTASRRSVVRRQYRRNRQRTASRPPGRRQPTATRAVPYTDHRSPITDHRLSRSGCACHQAERRSTSRGDEHPEADRSDAG